MSTFSCYGSFPTREAYVRREFTFAFLPQFGLPFFFFTEGSRTPDLQSLSRYIAPAEDIAWKTKGFEKFLCVFYSKVLVVWTLSGPSRNSNGMDSYLEVWEVSTVTLIPLLGQLSRYFQFGPSCMKLTLKFFAFWQFCEKWCHNRQVSCHLILWNTRDIWFCAYSMHTRLRLQGHSKEMKWMSYMVTLGTPVSVAGGNLFVWNTRDMWFCAHSLHTRLRLQGHSKEIKWMSFMVTLGTPVCVAGVNLFLWNTRDMWFCAHSLHTRLRHQGHSKEMKWIRIWWL